MAESLAATLVDIGDGGGGAIGVFRGATGIEIGMLAVIVGDRAHVVGVGPARAERFSCQVRFDGRGVAGAGKGV